MHGAMKMGLKPLVAALGFRNEEEQYKVCHGVQHLVVLQNGVGGKAKDMQKMKEVLDQVLQKSPLAAAAAAARRTRPEFEKLAAGVEMLDGRAAAAVVTSVEVGAKVREHIAFAAMSGADMIPHPPETVMHRVKGVPMKDSHDDGKDGSEEQQPAMNRLPRTKGGTHVFESGIDEYAPEGEKGADGAEQISLLRKGVEALNPFDRQPKNSEIHESVDDDSIWETHQVALNTGVYVLCSDACEQLETFEGVGKGGNRLVDLILEVATCMPKLKYLSLAGHSLGGLFTRFAAAELVYRGFVSLSFEQQKELALLKANRTLAEDAKACLIRAEPLHMKMKKVELFVYASFASPHLGDNRNNALWDEQGARLMRKTGHQMVLKDKEKMVYNLSRGVFLFSLSLFKQRFCYANARHDLTVPYYTSSFALSEPYEKLKALSNQFTIPAESNEYPHVVCMRFSQKIESCLPAQPVEQRTRSQNEAAESLPERAVQGTVNAISSITSSKKIVASRSFTSISAKVDGHASAVHELGAALQATDTERKLAKSSSCPSLPVKYRNVSANRFRSRRVKSTGSLWSDIQSTEKHEDVETEKRNELVTDFSKGSAVEEANSDEPDQSAVMRLIRVVTADPWLENFEKGTFVSTNENTEDTNHRDELELHNQEQPEEMEGAHAKDSLIGSVSSTRDVKKSEDDHNADHDSTSHSSSSMVSKVTGSVLKSVSMFSRRTTKYRVSDGKKVGAEPASALNAGAVLGSPRADRHSDIIGSKDISGAARSHSMAGHNSRTTDLSMREGTLALPAAANAVPGPAKAKQLNTGTGIFDKLMTLPSLNMNSVPVMKGMTMKEDAKQVELVYDCLLRTSAGMASDLGSAERVFDIQQKWSATKLVAGNLLHDVLEMRRNLCSMPWVHVNVELNATNTHSHIIVRFPRISTDGMDVIRHFAWNFVAQVCIHDRAPAGMPDPAGLKDFQAKPRLRSNVTRASNILKRPLEIAEASVSDLRAAFRKPTKSKDAEEVRVDTEQDELQESKQPADIADASVSDLRAVFRKPAGSVESETLSVDTDVAESHEPILQSSLSRTRTLEQPIDSETDLINLRAAFKRKASGTTSKKFGSPEELDHSSSGVITRGANGSLDNSTNSMGGRISRTFSLDSREEAISESEVDPLSDMDAARMSAIRKRHSDLTRSKAADEKRGKEQAHDESTFSSKVKKIIIIPHSKSGEKKKVQESVDVPVSQSSDPGTTKPAERVGEKKKELLTSDIAALRSEFRKR
ncbi:hypothetical protein FVE85_1360 [Porphyridium purpureum]|uniref:DUF676 domain-containing protein n=1 Tax=Porphyridium purpureum TaxID=35688 RepID=A0A5J4YVB2_PORPP|nr:hypothetical protein FVE85_1360 [Porphyridium purpureum]|eukprot:POR7914..scf209_3